MNKHSRQGISVFEVVIAVSIIALISVSVIAAFHFYLRAGLDLTSRVQATLLAEEGIEGVRYLRDSSWDTYIAPLQEGTTYYLLFSGSVWEATTTASRIDGIFTRTLLAENVYRNASDDIVPSTTPSSTLDPGTRKIVVEVEWNISTTSRGDIILESYLTNIR